MLPVGVVSPSATDVSYLLGLALDRFQVAVTLHANTATEAMSRPGASDVDTWVVRISAQRCWAQLAPGRVDSAQPCPMVALCDGGEDECAEALANGASAVVSLHDSVFDIGAAIHAASRRELFVSPALLRRLDRGLAEVLAARQGGTGGGRETLSERELRVLEEMATGMSNSAIGAILHISPATVSTHVGNILRKLRAANRTEAVCLALDASLINGPRRRVDRPPAVDTAGA